MWLSRKALCFEGLSGAKLHMEKGWNDLLGRSFPGQKPRWHLNKRLLTQKPAKCVWIQMQCCKKFASFIIKNAFAAQMDGWMNYIKREFRQTTELDMLHIHGHPAQW